MPVEMIGWVAPQVSSEILDPQGPVFCPDTVARTAKLHEDAGFDRVLVGYFTHAPDGFIIATHAATATERLSFLIAHRPGFVSPTLAARKFATLDQLTRGRVAVHIISGGSDADQAKDGDYAAHADRYRRSAEYIEVLKKAWMEPGSFDHHGDFYRVDGAYSQIRCFQDPRIPVYGGGGSDSAVAELSPYIDVFMLWGEPLDATSEFMQRVRQAASATQNPITFSLSTRPILADTEGKAWDKARDILKRIQGPVAERCAHTAKRRFATSVGRGSLSRCTRFLSLYGTRYSGRCTWELDGAGGNAGYGCQRDASVLPTRRNELAHPWLRPCSRYRSVRSGVDPQST